MLWRALQTGRGIWFAGSGLLLGTAFIMKQPAIVLIAAGGCVTLGHFLSKRPVPWHRLAVALGCYVPASVVPYAAICVWVWWLGVFDRFWFWTYEVARGNTAFPSLETAAQSMWSDTYQAVQANCLIWVLAMIGAILLVVTRREKTGRCLLVLGVLMFSIFSLYPFLLIRRHYYIALLPVVAMLAGYVASAGIRWTLKRRMPSQGAQETVMPRKDRGRQAALASRGTSPTYAVRGVATLLAIVIVAGSIVLPICWNRDFYFRSTPELACRQLYGGNPFLEAAVIADYVRKHSTADQQVAVIGSEAEIYFYSQRRAATGYVYVYSLTEPGDAAVKMQKQMIAEIEAAKPEFLILVHVETSLFQKASTLGPFFNWVNAYARKFYRRTGIADIVSLDHTAYRWEEDLLRYQPQSTCYVLLMRKK